MIREKELDRIVDAVVGEILTETAAKNSIHIINENRESKNLSNARHYLVGIGYTPEKAQETLDAMRSDIPNSRVCRCKFMTGLCRMFVEGELTNYNTMSGLNQTLKLMQGHENDYDSNLNGMKAADLINRFATAVQGDVQKDRESLSSQQFDSTEDGDYNGYTIVPINSFGEASQYSDYTQWCVTRESYSWNNYTQGGRIKFYFLLKAGFEEMEEPLESGNPLDEYGLSMVAVSVNLNGSLSTCTSRWNHDNGGNDAVMNTAQISRLIGRNFYDVFLPEDANKFNYFNHKRLKKYLEHYYGKIFFDHGQHSIMTTHDGLIINVGKIEGRNGMVYPIVINRRINFLDKLTLTSNKQTVADFHVIFPQFEEGFNTKHHFNKINNTFILMDNLTYNIGRMDGTLVFPEWLKGEDMILPLTNGFTLFNSKPDYADSSYNGNINLLDIELEPVFKGIHATHFDDTEREGLTIKEASFKFKDRRGASIQIEFHTEDSNFYDPEKEKYIPYTDINSYLASEYGFTEKYMEKNHFFENRILSRTLIITENQMKILKNILSEEEGKPGLRYATGSYTVRCNLKRFHKAWDDLKKNLKFYPTREEAMRKRKPDDCYLFTMNGDGSFENTESFESDAFVKSVSD
jgi:hypothetical protein